MRSAGGQQVAVRNVRGRAATPLWVSFYWKVNSAFTTKGNLSVFWQIQFSATGYRRLDCTKCWRRCYLPSVGRWGGCILDPAACLFLCVCACACLHTAAFPRIQARLPVAADRTERLQCVKNDGFIPSCLSESEEAALLEKPEPQALGWLRANRNCFVHRNGARYV